MMTQITIETNFSEARGSAELLNVQCIFNITEAEATLVWVEIGRFSLNRSNMLMAFGETEIRIAEDTAYEEFLIQSHDSYEER